MKKQRTRRKIRVHQGLLAFSRHGGARKGAGRKPKAKVAGPSHAARAPLVARHPLLVTQRLCAELPSLRHGAEFEVVRGAIAAAAERDGFRIVHFSVQSNHLHYICEASDGRRFTSGMRSLGVMIARRLNKLWKRRGPVFAERFHARALSTPSEVRHALAYVLHNARKHGIFGDDVDPFSSGAWFDGWRVDVSRTPRDDRSRATRALDPAPTATAETWLLRVGWRRHGLIDRREIPGGKAARLALARDEARAADSIQRSLAAAALSRREKERPTMTRLPLRCVEPPCLRR